MRKRSLLLIILMALMPLTLHAQSQAQKQSAMSGREEKKTLRIFVENDSPVALKLIEAMREKAYEYGFQFTFVSNSSEPFEVRIVLTHGSGKAWDSLTTLPPGSVQFPVTYFYSSALAFTAQGRTLFTVAQSAPSLQSVIAAIAKETIKNLYSHYTAVKTPTPVNAADLANQPPRAVVEAATNSPNALQSLPAEPGIYYQKANHWIRLGETALANMKAKGVGKALLSFGLSGIRMTQVYNGAQSPLQIVEATPTFYVRGIAVSSTETALLRLARKSDHREILAGSTTAFQAQVGYRAQDICEVMVTQIAVDVIAITPKSALESGEYLLSFTTTGVNDGGYDFGVARNKK
ncbi:MAG: hypothetical protein HY231_16685 [Acidobacteria bacterium]|nr:hypothetical protein [Acidobacteriota bacterium]